MRPVALSKRSSMEAWPRGWRSPEPLKMTSAMAVPRSCLAELSPITQRTASIRLDLPQPLGPTRLARLEGKRTVVGSTKDLNPASFIDFRRTVLVPARGEWGFLAMARLVGRRGIVPLSGVGIWGRKPPLPLRTQTPQTPLVRGASRLTPPSTSNHPPHPTSPTSPTSNPPNPPCQGGF